MKVVCFFLCLMIISFFYYPVWAQGIEKKGKVELSPLGGMYFKNDIQFKNSFLIDQKSCYLAGGRVGVYLSSRVALEATFIYSLAKGTILEEDIEKEENADSRSMLYAGNIVYHMGEIDLVPFITFGAGMLSFKVPKDSSFPLRGNHLDFNTGGGVKYFMWENFAFRADFRIHFIFPRGQAEDVPGFIKALEFNGGISLSF